MVTSKLVIIRKKKNYVRRKNTIEIMYLTLYTRPAIDAQSPQLTNVRHSVGSSDRRLRVT